jgi:hypothetical protein
MTKSNIAPLIDELGDTRARIAALERREKELRDEIAALRRTSRHQVGSKGRDPEAIPRRYGAGCQIFGVREQERSPRIYHMRAARPRGVGMRAGSASARTHQTPTPVLVRPDLGRRLETVCRLGE